MEIDMRTYTGKNCITYIGDAPNPGDMELIEKNCREALRIQREYWGKLNRILKR